MILIPENGSVTLGASFSFAVFVTVDVCELEAISLVFPGIIEKKHLCLDILSPFLDA